MLKGKSCLLFGRDDEMMGRRNKKEKREKKIINIIYVRAKRKFNVKTI